MLCALAYLSHISRCVSNEQFLLNWSWLDTRVHSAATLLSNLLYGTIGFVITILIYVVVVILCYNCKLQ